MFRRALLFLLFAWFVTISGPGRLKAQEEGDVAFDTRTDPAFGDATVPLREFLRGQHVSSRLQHFCIAGYRSAGGDDRRAWIHWTEGHKMILWRGATDQESLKSSIARSRRITDLKKDVVPTDADIKGSNYLVSKAWVGRVTSDCAARGTKYEVRSK